MVIIQLYKILNVSYSINFIKLVMDRLLISVQFAIIFEILKKLDQHVNFQQDRLIIMQKICVCCHSSSLTCFRTTINVCSICDSTLNRILKGLKCPYQPGYYESSNICTNCPDTEDSSQVKVQIIQQQLINMAYYYYLQFLISISILRVSTYLWRYINKRI
ncbi:unnamed protein product [Paramecium sonneborni]|uniref:Transmembrane protein n=1 Tax=Paramecium sonneborni TaxID=65129 RepID=A0A8S1RCI1_9CILI|nr:unnamed protein product [Paramecium sonneborni]